MEMTNERTCTAPNTKLDQPASYVLLLNSYLAAPIGPLTISVDFLCKVVGEMRLPNPSRDRLSWKRLRFY